MTTDALEIGVQEPRPIGRTDRRILDPDEEEFLDDVEKVVQEVADGMQAVVDSCTKAIDAQHHRVLEELGDLRKAVESLRPVFARRVRTEALEFAINRSNKGNPSEVVDEAVIFEHYLETGARVPDPSEDGVR
jgi:hypothetical protein